MSDAWGLAPEQIEILARPINGTRVANRTQGGKELSYLEAWDVKAHLIRVFGYGGFDTELVDYGLVAVREYLGGRDGQSEMVECVWHARVRLTVKNPVGFPIATYTEGAVGSTSGPASMLGEHHDNALKTAESDALKRCAIYLGNQFGLSLYANGTKKDVIKGTVMDPKEDTRLDADKEARLQHSVGTEPAEKVGIPADIPEQVQEAIATAQERLGAQPVEEPPGGYVDEYPKGPEPEPEHEYGDPTQPFDFRSAQGKRMYAAIRAAKVEEAQRIPEISAVIGREIASTKELNVGEASKVIAFYEGQGA